MRFEAENKESFQFGNKKSVISKNNEHQKGKGVEKKDGWEYPKYTAKKSASTNNVGITVFIPVDLTEEIEVMNENPPVSNIKQGDLARSVSFNKLASCSNSTRACSGLNEKAKEAKTLERQRAKEVAKKGHVKPAHNFLDAHEKFLIGVATKGVVKLFNAVNKAQHAQKGLNPSKSKDAKVIGKRRREAFLSGIGKKPRNASDTHGKGPKPSEKEDNEPAWAPLRDSYMLTSSKLKNWDKMPVRTLHECFLLCMILHSLCFDFIFSYFSGTNVDDDMGEMLRGSSDDED
ncbi:hypothetical protein GIB67_013491 [Kingdonia uniflora]|uniref:RRP15-like protein n=1 Tax=Kingdonia uniflora TaxID=39325 RepID=A0A7J7LRG1_9MAGN|nr:hypothetical protein GIB67_013491 [Kingdonia uniflora]